MCSLDGSVILRTEANPISRTRMAVSPEKATAFSLCPNGGMRNGACRDLELAGDRVWFELFVGHGLNSAHQEALSR